MNVHSNAWLFQEATTVGNGNAFQSGRNNQITLFITGDSTSRTIYFEGSDSENNWFAIPAIKFPELTVASSTTGNDEVWVIDTSNWVSVRTRISAIAGGTVKITGKIVDSGTTMVQAGSVSLTNSAVAIPVDLQYHQLSAAEAIPTSIVGRLANDEEVILHNAISATADAEMDVNGFNTTTLLIAGTFNATISVVGKYLNSSAEYGLKLINVSTGESLDNTTSGGLYRVIVTGLEKIKVYVTWTSGTSVTIKGWSTILAPVAKVIQRENYGKRIDLIGGASGVSGSIRDTTAIFTARQDISKYSMIAFRINNLLDKTVSITLVEDAPDAVSGWSARAIDATTYTVDIPSGSSRIHYLTDLDWEALRYMHNLILRVAASSNPTSGTFSLTAVLKR